MRDYNNDGCEENDNSYPTRFTKKNKDETPADKQCQWARNGQNYYPSYPSAKGLPAGQYTISFQQGVGYYFIKSKIEMDELFILEDSVTEDVMSAMRTFWASEEKYRNFGFLWKRGVLLYGPPGTGKTSTVQLLAKEVENIGGISVYLNNPDYFSGLKVLREIEPDKPIVVILEDIDSLIDDYGESDVLSLLDGEMQLDNIVFVATTNYINKLPGRIKNRPSRFDYLRQIGFPNASNRARYLLSKNSIRFENNQAELDVWVKETENFSIAHIKELIISVECLDVSFDIAVKRLQALIQSENDGNMDVMEDVFSSEVNSVRVALSSAAAALAPKKYQ